MLSHWVSRSTYDDECPVTSCMAAIVAGWQFAPMPERMNVVIPVQVKRTAAPLGAAENVIFLAPDVVDAGEGCQDSQLASHPLGRPGAGGRSARPDGIVGAWTGIANARWRC